MLTIIILFITAYLAGSINISILLFKTLKKDDPRSKFSGNAGTVNIYRQAGLFWAAIVFLLDFGKAVGLSALALYLIEAEYVPIIGFSLILGNRFPCFHHFRGGKGVANYLGFTAVITPLLSAAAAALWVVIYRIVKVPFIASLSMTFILAFVTIKINNFNPLTSIVSILTVLLIIFNHKKNLIEYKNKLNN
jgi:acyl phosphate:glycerol-3-phosphate acyltransferase